MNKIFIPISTDGDPPVYVPVLKIGYSGERDYLLKMPDRRQVRAVSEYLNGEGLDVFLGGEVVQSRFDDSKYVVEPYKSIDLVTVGPEPQAKKIFEKLTNLRNGKSPFDYHNVRFRVRQAFARPKFDPNEVEEFWINAARANSNSSPMNLSLVVDNLFRKYQRK